MGELTTLPDRAVTQLKVATDHGLVLLLVLAMLGNLDHMVVKKKNTKKTIIIIYH